MASELQCEMSQNRRQAKFLTYYLLSVVGVGAGKFLGVRRIFAQISSNLHEQNSKEWAHFFKSKHFKHHFCPDFPQTCLNFPQLARKRYNKNMTSQKSMHFEFRRHFCEIKAHTAILRRFSHILPKFPQIFPGFSPNQKFWGTLAPRAPPPPTPVFASQSKGIQFGDYFFDVRCVN